MLAIEIYLPMPEAIFDHDRLDVYRLVIEYMAETFGAAVDYQYERPVEVVW